MRIAAMVSILLVAAGCERSAPADPEPMAGQAPGAVTVNDEFALAYGETARVDGHAVTITFEDVNEDSRCPVGVECVWAGNARIALAIDQAGRPPAAVGLNTTLEPRAAVYQGYRLRLIELTPHPVNGQPIEMADYVARLIVTRD